MDQFGFWGNYENAEQNSTLDKLSSKNVMSEVCVICISQDHFCFKKLKRIYCLISRKPKSLVLLWILPFLPSLYQSSFLRDVPFLWQVSWPWASGLHKILRNPGDILELNFGFRYARPDPCLSWTGVNRAIDTWTSWTESGSQVVPLTVLSNGSVGIGKGCLSPGLQKYWSEEE